MDRYDYFVKLGFDVAEIKMAEMRDIGNPVTDRKVAIASEKTLPAATSLLLNSPRNTPD